MNYPKVHLMLERNFLFGTIPDLLGTKRANPRSRPVNSMLVVFLSDYGRAIIAVRISLFLFVCCIVLINPAGSVLNGSNVNVASDELDLVSMAGASASFKDLSKNSKGKSKGSNRVLNPVPAGLAQSLSAQRFRLIT